MTSLALVLWIAAAIVLQIAAYLSIEFWNHWLEYRALRHRIDEFNLPIPTEEFVPNVASWAGLRAFRVDRRVVEDVAQSICSFYLVPEDGQALSSFRPGQFLTFSLDIPWRGERHQVVRCYSLSDAPQSDYYRISVKRISQPPNSDYPPGRASNFLHDQIAIGDVLQVRSPSGHFHIDQSMAPVVLIGGGIGITPMLSMLNWSLAEQPGREVWLFYGVRNGRELVMKTHLEVLAAQHPNFHLRFCLSEPLPEDVAGDKQIVSRVDVALLRLQLPLKPYHYFICGPTPMMETLVPALEAWGVPGSHIHFEAFGPASIKRKSSAAQAAPVEVASTCGSEIVVSFAKSGKQIPWSSAACSLLDFAEANGISVDSGCRAGGCGTCQTMIKSGEVAYRQAPDFDPEAGSCLLCVCTPKTSLTLEV